MNNNDKLNIVTKSMPMDSPITGLLIYQRPNLQVQPNNKDEFERPKVQHQRQIPNLLQSVYSGSSLAKLGNKEKMDISNRTQIVFVLNPNNGPAYLSKTKVTRAT